MNGLLGDRFLKRFAGNLKHRRQQSMSIPEARKPESDEEKIGESNNIETEDIGEKKKLAGIEETTQIEASKQ